MALQFLNISPIKHDVQMFPLALKRICSILYSDLRHTNILKAEGIVSHTHVEASHLTKYRFNFTLGLPFLFCK